MGNKNKAGSLKGKSLFFALLMLFTVQCLLFADLSFAEEKKTEEQKAKVPTVITSELLTADNKAKTALFEGSVVAKKGEMTLFSDKMLVYYADEKGSSNIKKIDAEGNVRLIKRERVVTSKFATYFSEPEEYIVFTGEPRASEGENVVTGTKMIYFMKDDRSIVENSKVFLINKERMQTKEKK
jgi:lipopolysaccharide export system protein LptA